MAPTVRNLDERIDGLEAVVADLGKTVTGLSNSLGESQAKVATVTTKLDAATQTLNTLQAQLASLTNSLSQTQAQFALSTAKLDTVSDNLRTTQAQLAESVKELGQLSKVLVALDTKIETIQADLQKVSKKIDEEFAPFKSRTETTLGFLKWIGGFAAGAFLTVVLAAFSVARSAGSLDATVLQQQKTLDLQQKVLEDIRRELVELRVKPK